MEHIQHLNKDKKLKKIIELQEPFVLSKQKNVHLHLCYSIMSQQLSKWAVWLANAQNAKGNSNTPQAVIFAAIADIQNVNERIWELEFRLGDWSFGLVSQ